MDLCALDPFARPVPLTRERPSAQIVEQASVDATPICRSAGMGRAHRIHSVSVESS